MVKVTRKRHGADFKENVGSEAIECALQDENRFITTPDRCAPAGHSKRNIIRRADHSNMRA